MEYIFQGRDGVCFLIKLQAFPVVFIRDRYKNKQVQMCRFYECVKAHAYENVGRFHPHLF